MAPLRLVVLISGNGTGLQNLLDRGADGRLAARVVRVIANKPGAVGLQRAARAGVAHEVITRKQCGGRDAFGERVFAACRQAQADLVCMAGFLDFLPIPDDFQNRVMNVHPALLPAFGGQGMYGEHVHQAVLASGAKVSGCTVHFADNEYDHGPIIVQRTVPVLDDDTPGALAARVALQEWEAYPEAIQLFGEGRMRVEGRRVRVLPANPGR